MKNDEGKFLGFFSPRYTQVPDELFDELLSELSGAELKVLLYVVRRTFGFKKDSDLISLSQMVSGIEKKDGTILDKGTGLHKDSVIKAAKSLVERGILLKTLKNSVKLGFTATEYALNIRNFALSDNPTRGLVRISRPALSEKPDTQNTFIQNTEKTFRNASNKEIKKKPVDKSIGPKYEYLVDLILQTCRDQHSLAFYRKIVKLIPEQAIFEALSQVREAIQLGRIREKPGAMFTDLIKRKAKELGLELGIELRNELREAEPRHEKLTESRGYSTPAEIMMAKGLR